MVNSDEKGMIGSSMKTCWATCNSQIRDALYNEKERLSEGSDLGSDREELENSFSVLSTNHKLIRTSQDTYIHLARPKGSNREILALFLRNW